MGRETVRLSERTIQNIENLVEDELYESKSDFIRQAIQNQLQDKHNKLVYKEKKTIESSSRNRNKGRTPKPFVDTD